MVRRAGELSRPLTSYRAWESRSCTLAGQHKRVGLDGENMSEPGPGCESGRTGPAPGLESTVGLVVVEWVWVSGPKNMRVEERTLLPASCSVGAVSKSALW